MNGDQDSNHLKHLPQEVPSLDERDYSQDIDLKSDPIKEINLETSKKYDS